MFHSVKDSSGAAWGTISWVFSLIRTTAVFPAGFVYEQNSNWNLTGGPFATGVVVATGDFVAVAVDFDNSAIWIKSTSNGNWNNNVSANPATNTLGQDFSAAVTGAPFFCSINIQDNVGQVATVNFGATPGALSSSSGTWNFTPPSGYTNW